MTNPQHLFTLTYGEIAQLSALDVISHCREVFGECLWLHLEPHQRTWVLDTAFGRSVVHIEDTHSPEVCDQWLPVSARVLHFAETCEDSVTLALAGDAIVATSANRSAVIDLLRPNDTPPEPRPYTDVASAVIEREAFSANMFSARWMPRGAAELEAPVPPMWLQLADGAVALHIDWTDQVGGRSTYRIGTPVTGEPVTVSILHHIVAQWASTVRTWSDDDSTMTIAVRDVEYYGSPRRALWLSAADSSLLLWILNPLLVRWEDQIDTLLGDAFKEVDQDETTWRVVCDGVGVRIVLHAGHPDVARVSATVLQHVDPTLDLLTELNALNAAATGTRLWIEDSAVRAAADVRCTEIEGLVAAVRDVAGSAARYKPLLAALG